MIIRRGDDYKKIIKGKMNTERFKLSSKFVELRLRVLEGSKKEDRSLEDMDKKVVRLR